MADTEPVVSKDVAAVDESGENPKGSASVDQSTESIVPEHTNGTSEKISTEAENTSEKNGKTLEAQAPTENAPSNRVEEGRKWNNRDQNKKSNFRPREYKDYRQNIKSDLTSQKESDDPVAIRKQVIASSTFSKKRLIVSQRLSSTCPTLISSPTNFSSQRSRATRTTPSLLA